MVVEDDRQLGPLVRKALREEGHAVDLATSALDADHAARTNPYDLVVLDLGLPDGDGEALLHELRRRQGTPLIVITARDTEGLTVRLLDAGADDYLVKPFGLAELLARMRVALRHRGTRVEAAVTRYAAADVEVDLGAHRVRRGGRDVHLTPTEFALLAHLVRHAGRVVTHRQLLQQVWGADYVGHTHYLRLYMGQLRAKLEAEPADPRWLLTEPGIGYRVAAPAGDA